MDLFSEPELPPGFAYEQDFLSAEEERGLADHLSALPFKAFEFRGFLGRRRVVSFGWRYDFNGRGLQRIEDIPAFLYPLRDRAAGFAGLAPHDLQHVLLTEYAPGAAIGWHRDRPEFGDVVGISLLSPCAFRLRRRHDAGWSRITVPLAPRSAYHLTGEARTTWEHSIPGLAALRYSITFRNLRPEPQDRLKA